MRRDGQKPLTSPQPPKCHDVIPAHIFFGYLHIYIHLHIHITKQTDNAAFRKIYIKCRLANARINLQFLRSNDKYCIAFATDGSGSRTWCDVFTYEYIQTYFHICDCMTYDAMQAIRDKRWVYAIQIVARTRLLYNSFNAKTINIFCSLMIVFLCSCVYVHRLYHCVYTLLGPKQQMQCN